MRAVARAQKGTYFKENKWIGASPHERIIHHKNCVFALYRVPPGEKTDHIDGYLPAPMETVKRTRGWLAINSDPIFAALWCSEKGTLTPAPENGTRVRVDAGTRAFVATINPASRWKSFAHFIAALEKGEPQFDQEKCMIDWYGLDGRHLRGSWSGGGEVGGKKTSLPRQMLFLGPWINSQLGSGVIKITEGPDCLTLDFPSLLD